MVGLFCWLLIGCVDGIVSVGCVGLGLLKLRWVIGVNGCSG